ncbi:MAG: polysaccharide pyruvyl transferase family protein [Brachybacterium sp.]|nr:polysaccharide pyruvyl transferase family protein [Brachybacterium sp.]
MRVALLCDVDQTLYHVGDEAIGLASTRALRSRGLDVVTLSRHEKYGPAGTPPEPSIDALVFPWPIEDRRRYLGEIRRVIAGDEDALPAEDKVFRIRERLAEVDGLVIGGGGALNSTYGWLLYERLATALLVRAAGKPVVLTGQSLGPVLDAWDRAVLRELLEISDLVGVRDSDSLRLARSLCPEHPALVRTADDATILDLAPASPQADRIAVTLGASPGPHSPVAYVERTAALLDALAAHTGAEV